MGYADDLRRRYRGLEFEEDTDWQKAYERSYQMPGRWRRSGEPRYVFVPIMRIFALTNVTNTYIPRVHSGDDRLTVVNIDRILSQFKACFNLALWTRVEDTLMWLAQYDPQALQYKPRR